MFKSLGAHGGGTTSEDYSRNCPWKSSSLLFPHSPTIGLIVFKGFFFNEHLVVFPPFGWATFACVMEQPWLGG